MSFKTSRVDIAFIRSLSVIRLMAVLELVTTSGREIRERDADIAAAIRAELDARGVRRIA